MNKYGFRKKVIKADPFLQFLNLIVSHSENNSEMSEKYENMRNSLLHYDGPYKTVMSNNESISNDGLISHFLKVDED